MILVTGGLGFELVNLRIGTIWGPLGPTASPFFAFSQLVNAAVTGQPPDITPPRLTAYADIRHDQCYVMDRGRAADRLNHQSYNVSSGRLAMYGDVAGAVKRVVTDAPIELPAGRGSAGPAANTCLAIDRLHRDTGDEPAYDLDGAVADYIGWLRSQ